ncbi:uncharacterized protein LOC130899479 isoform X2 [Diorhabda carinulata]|uniref:uncharacterized protein LOC130899479 isoform X2 n=1 Tax=Diorhabda carinulata TaxID=1163345 RepID=UPI0025A1C6FE|nr:uncharacterized protein LOC130899479 isoform X2 [Diorhabda carinulata]
MSRKFRLEEERAKHLQDEIQEEEDKLKAQKERIFGPIVWKRLPSGIKIMDLQSVNYIQAVNIIMEFFVKKNVIFRNTTRFLEDEDSVTSFRDKLLISMMDRSSIIATKEEEDPDIDEEIVGILLLKAVKKCDYGRVFSRVALNSGKPYASIIKFLNGINRKIDIFEEFQCDSYLRIFE